VSWTRASRKRAADTSGLQGEFVVLASSFLEHSVQAPVGDDICVGVGEWMYV
jgi:hypothetical protein